SSSGNRRQRRQCRCALAPTPEAPIPSSHHVLSLLISLSLSLSHRHVWCSGWIPLAGTLDLPRGDIDPDLEFPFYRSIVVEAVMARGGWTMLAPLVLHLVWLLKPFVCGVECVSLLGVGVWCLVSNPSRVSAQRRRWWRSIGAYTRLLVDRVVRVSVWSCVCVVRRLHLPLSSMVELVVPLMTLFSHQQGVVQKRNETVLGSLVLGSRSRLGPVFESSWSSSAGFLAIPVLGLPIGDLGTKDPKFGLLSSHPDLFGGSELPDLRGSVIPHLLSLRFSKVLVASFKLLLRCHEESDIRGNKIPEQTSGWHRLSGRAKLRFV
ncbi:hypothetical protein HID58_074168, partial [Brassica napus]